MYKGFAFSIVLVLLSTSATFADVGKTQGHLIGTGNGLSFAGDGQGATISITNSAGATDTSDVSGIEQDAGVVGEQSQLYPDWSGLELQWPDLNANLWQDVFNVDGLSSVSWLQDFIGGLFSDNYYKDIDYVRCGP